MNTKKTILSTLSTLLFALALVGFTKSYYIQQYADSLILAEIPIDLSIGGSFENKFTVTNEGGYFIWLVFNRENKTDELACKVGMDPSYYNCVDIESLVDVSWEISKDDAVVGTGTSSDYPWTDAGSELQRTLARIELPVGDYLFKLKINKDAQELNILDPKLKIASHPLDYQDELTYGVLVFYLSAGSLLLSILLFSSKHILKYFKRG